MGFRRTERSSPGSDRCTQRGSTPGRVLVLSAQVTAGALNPRPTSPSPTTGPSAVCWDEASQKPSTAFSSSRTYSESQTTASNQNAGTSAKRPSARPRPSVTPRPPRSSFSKVLTLHVFHCFLPAATCAAAAACSVTPAACRFLPRRKSAPWDAPHPTRPPGSTTSSDGLLGQSLFA